jgi:putative ABC transport system substrate-binding protein
MEVFGHSVDPQPDDPSIKRRIFLTAGLAAAAGVSRRSFAESTPARIGFLVSGTQKNSAAYVDSVRAGLSDNGLIENRDYVFELRWADGHYERFPALVNEVMQRNPRLIIVTTIVAAAAAQRANPAMPLVMTGLNDPVKAGLIQSLARPGGSITGVSNVTADITPKLIEVVHEMFPRATTVAALINPAQALHPSMIDSARAVAKPFSITIRSVEVKSPESLDETFTAAAKVNPTVLIVMPDAMLNELRERIAVLALQARIPVFSYIPEFVEVGLLLGYGSSRLEQYRRTGTYVKRILDGARPADLPVEQPTRIELGINLRTARALGVTVPASLLARADRVVE